ncbi:Sulfotransferase domain-containing protein [Kytococcus aerolatus]|uniref:Sulfotransferase domain-containing protein n=1 Tax=Kytococcus aerolatus TaxID=592308 RepID=A0A212T6Q6_9MICO|nr:sulfotransferase [Kytococcus aerolatus]SNC61743.1 Sulfotransferase domain-containing protein [Kytococcus aerolatus]
MSHAHFLVIGAQKCGTTSFYEDLRSHPQLALPDKESSFLSGRTLSAAEVHAALATIPTTPTTALIGEVDTTYSMRTVHPEVIGNAAHLRDLRVIYIVRDPLRRTLSHHHHDYALGRAPADADTAVRTIPEMVDNSRYAFQISPWIDLVGVERILPIRFEHFTTRREETLKQALNFLGVDPTLGHATGIAHNAAGTKVVARGPWSVISNSSLYRKRIRPLVPEAGRKRLMKAVLPKAPPRPATPSRKTLEWLQDQLSEDVQQFESLLNLDGWWDLQATVNALRPLHSNG